MVQSPTFPYHPDPVATGSVVAAKTACIVCEQARGFVYTGPVYATEEYEDEICPWCIADGRAAEQLDATFTDDLINEDEETGEVPEEVVEAITRRTPGFAGWQQEEWMYHCSDGAAFLGRVGARELATST